MATLGELSNQAGFVFEGQIEQLGASTAAGFPASAQTAIVRVSKIFKSPNALAGYAGQRITVSLQSPVSLRQGQSAVFFTHGVHYAQSLVVSEVGNLPPDPDMQAQLTKAVQAGTDSQVSQRLAKAVVIVSGTAAATRPYSQAPIRPVSEHDPKWQVATITVETVEKGANPGVTADILFASSTDIAWYRSPKVKQGDRGVWLLQLTDNSGRAVPAQAIVDASDFQTIDQLTHIRTLLSDLR